MKIKKKNNQIRWFFEFRMKCLRYNLKNMSLFFSLFLSPLFVTHFFALSLTHSLLLTNSLSLSLLQSLLLLFTLFFSHSLSLPPLLTHSYSPSLSFPSRISHSICHLSHLFLSSLSLSLLH